MVCNNHLLLSVITKGHGLLLSVIIKGLSVIIKGHGLLLYYLGAWSIIICNNQGAWSIIIWLHRLKFVSYRMLFMWLSSWI